jgi:ornithine cyclodeaminase/alanine dehydrogenase-like protein (mu-crystallin family)
MNNNSSGDSELLANLLRISTEPCTYIDDKQVHGFLTDNPVEYFQFVKSCLQDISAGKASLEMTPKQIFTDKDCEGDFRVMPCVIRRNGGVSKTVKIVGTNIQQSVVPDQITVGKAFALHPKDNYISHVFDCCLLSSARTGVCAALAMYLLAEDVEKLSIIGAGRVGYYSALYSCSILSVKEVNICDEHAGRAGDLVKLLAGIFPEIQFQESNSLTQNDSDAIVLATTSKQPICSPDDSSASLVISLGADTDDQHELHEDWVGNAEFYVDTLDSARFGDLSLWQKSDLISVDDLTDLFSILRNPKNISAGRKVFVSTGSAIFDNITIAYMLERMGS